MAEGAKRVEYALTKSFRDATSEARTAAIDVLYSGEFVERYPCPSNAATYMDRVRLLRDALDVVLAQQRVLR